MTALPLLPAPVPISVLPAAGGANPTPQSTDLVPVAIWLPNKFGPGVGGWTTFKTTVSQLAGATSAAANTILNGVGPPTSSIGNNGDFYIDTGNSVIYGPKAGGAWPPGTSLVGPSGPPGPPGTQPVQRMAIGTPIVVQTTDEIINVSITGVKACTLPPSAPRLGKLLLFKDVGGNFAVNPLTITAAPGETIEGLGAVTMSTNFALLRLVPRNDGTGTGWYIAN
jgi:hypothetical protein